MKRDYYWSIVYFVLSCASLYSQDSLKIGELYNGKIEKYCILSDGTIVLCWNQYCEDSLQPRYDMHAMLFSSDLKILKSAFPLLPDSPKYRVIADIQSMPGTFLVTWRKFSEDAYGIETQAHLFSNNGSPIGYTMTLDIETRSPIPQSLALDNNNFIVAWTEEENNKCYLSFQLFGENQTKISPEFKIQVNLWYKVRIRGIPYKLLKLSQNRYIAFWASTHDHPDYLARINFQLFSDNGGLLKSSYAAVKTMYPPFPTYFAITSTDKEFRVWWMELDGLYYKTYNSDGISIHHARKITSEFAERFKVLAVKPDRFLLLFDKNGENFEKDIIVQLYSRADELLAEKRIFSNDALTVWNANAIQVQDSTIVISWRKRFNDKNGYSSGEYIQLFNQDLDYFGDEFTIFPSHFQNTFLRSIITLPKNRFLVSYRYDLNDGYRIFNCFPHNHKLHPFNLIYPTTDNTIDSLSCTFQWQPTQKGLINLPWELRYDVMFDTSVDFKNAKVNTVNADTFLEYHSLVPGQTYFWKVLAKNISGDSLWSSDTNAFFVSHTATSVEKKKTSPQIFLTISNYPNPFNPTTTISFALPKEGFVTLKIYDITGRLVRVLVQEHKLAGQHSILWDGLDDAGQKVAAGVYLYRIEFVDAAGEKMVLSRKMSLLK
jgi:hypothetical protein